MPQLNILKQFINETLIRGRRLNKYTTIIKRHIMRALKDEELRGEFNATGSVTFRLQNIPELNDIKYLRYVTVDISSGAPSASASYEFDLNATEKERKNSDLWIRLRLPVNFQDQLLSFVDEELTDAISHELEHSGQETWELMDCIGDRVNASDIWLSLKNAAEYYLCPAEIAAHITGFMKRAKRNKLPLSDVINDELTHIYHTGLGKNHNKKELEKLIYKIRDEYVAYASKRYPEVNL